HHRHHPGRLRHALSVQIVQSGIPALQESAGAGVAGAAPEHFGAVRTSRDMSTDCLFREDAYLKECRAEVVGLTEQGGIVTDRTVFYATSGGQPGDRGNLLSEGGVAIPIGGAVYTDPTKTMIAQVPSDVTAARPQVGRPVTLSIDWDLRYR